MFFVVFFKLRALRALRGELVMPGVVCCCVLPTSVVICLKR